MALQSIFELRMRQFVSCPTCRGGNGCPLETPINELNHYIYDTTATELRDMREEMGPKPPFGALLRHIEEKALKPCDGAPRHRQSAGGVHRASELGR